MDIVEELKTLLGEKVSDFGAAELAEPFKGYRYVVSLVYKLSDGVISEIENGPTHTYFHHYRTINRLLDDTVHSAGMLLQKSGFDFYPVAASQSVNEQKDRTGKMLPSFEGVYSHKKSAVLCGLGAVGQNNLFIHRKFGCGVRLSTFFTDCPEVLVLGNGLFGNENEYDCDNCGKCVAACPAGAITDKGFNAQRCSDWMKNAYQQIGRGAVCGICMNVCMKRHSNMKNKYTDSVY